MGISKSNILMFRLILVASLISITYLSTAKTDFSIAEDINDKISHVLAFIFLALIVDFSFPRYGFSLGKILPLLGYGLLLEVIQFYLPFREFDILDLIADAGGLMAYRLSLPLLKRIFFLKRRWVTET